MTIEANPEEELQALPPQEEEDEEEEEPGVPSGTGKFIGLDMA
jgi:hypothetical protein